MQSIIKKFLAVSIIVFLASVTASDAAATTPKIVQNPVTFGFQETTTPTRAVDTIIVHATYNPTLKTQTFAGALVEWKDAKVSPHYAIDKAGTIYQLVQEKNVAWHAGVSSLPNGDTNVNTRSIGIELIYSNKETPTTAQYASLQYLIKNIEGRYTIKYVLGHEQIAPVRKVDPWNFDYSKISEVFKPATTVFEAPVTLSADIFQSAINPLTPAQQAVMKNYSYRAGCPVSLDDLRAVNVSYSNFSGVTQQGTLIVNQSVADKTVAAFKALFEAKFPIKQIQSIDSYEGMDTISMAADNTSAFNCRPVAGSTTFSEHSSGTAIDINPKENPSFAKAMAGEAFMKTAKSKGTITPATAKILKEAGFKWGGDWTIKKDYQHFSVSGK
ncbi:MAG: N-acetylmuramoyl-L-alanine amidase [Candidatus Paceibacterota bacterium]